MLGAFCAVMATLALAGCDDSRAHVRIVGSSTVFPFTTVVIENFMRHNPDFSAPVVEATGTGGGIKLFCGGVGPRHPDIVNASRRMTERELADCTARGTGPVVELQIGIDGVVVVQSRQGPALGLSRAELYRALSASPLGKAQTNQNWRDVNPDLPDLPIRVLGPSPASGTRDAFAELYLQPGCELLQADQTGCDHIREDGAWVDSADNDNLIVQKLVLDPRAIGVLGYSYLVRNRDRIRDIQIEGVSATVENIAEFRYPAARPLYIYVKADHVDMVPGLKQLLAEFSSERASGPGGYLERRGLVPSGDDVRAEQRARAMQLIPLLPEDLA